MIPRAALLVLIVQFALTSFGQVQNGQSRQQGGTVAVDLRVLEAGANATLEKETIRVTLPLSAAPGLGAKVVVWLASPKDVRSGDTIATVSANGRSVSAALPWLRTNYKLRRVLPNLEPDQPRQHSRCTEGCWIAELAIRQR